MPIGTIIGWLIGQLLIGFMLWWHNHEMKRNLTESSILVRQSFSALGLIFSYTAIGGLIGTFIEMLNV